MGSTNQNVIGKRVDLGICKILCADGSVKITHRYSRLFRGPDGTDLLLISFENVTERVRLETERADQEEVLKAFVYEGPQYCFVEDKEFKVRLISRAAAELIADLPSSEMIGRDILEYFGPDDQKRIMAARAESDERLESGETVFSKSILTFFKGEDIVKVSVQVKLLRLPSGAVMRGIIFVDITEVEQARQKAEDYLSAGTGKYSIQNEDYSTLYMSEKFSDFVSQKMIDKINENDLSAYTDFWPDFDDAYWIEHRKKINILPTGEIWESPEPERVLTAKLDERYIVRERRWFVADHSGSRLLYTNIQDVTEITKARETVEKYLESGINAYGVQNEKFENVYCSKAFTDLTGYTIEDFSPTSEFYIDFDPKSEIYARQAVSQKPDGEVLDGGTLRVRTKRGEILWLNRKARWFRGINRERLLMVSFEDRTALENERQFTQSLIEGSSALIVTQSDNERIHSVSQAFVDFMGYSREYLVGKDIIDLYHTECQHNALKTRQSFKKSSNEVTVERRLFTADNQIKTVLINLRARGKNANYGSIFTLTDIISAKEAERKLQELVEIDGSQEFTHGAD